MRIDPRHAQWQLAGATLVSIGALGFFTVLAAAVTTALTSPDKDLLANETVAWVLYASDALTVLGLYGLFGPIWNLPMPGPPPEEKHRPWQWLMLPIVVLAVSEIGFWSACVRASKGASVVPSVPDIIRLIPWVPVVSIVLLLVIVATYCVLAVRIANGATPFNRSTINPDESDAAPGAVKAASPVKAPQAKPLSTRVTTDRAPLPATASAAPVPQVIPPSPPVKVAPKDENIWEVLSDVESLLRLREAIDPKKIQGTAEQKISSMMFMTVVNDRHDHETVRQYYEECHERVQAAYQKVIEKGTRRDARVDALVINGPKSPVGIKQIVRYLRYLETGRAD